MTGVVVVGAGVMGERHCRVVAESPRAKLVRVVDPDLVAGQAAAERYGAQWSPELDSAGADAVVIAAPTEVHEPVATWALGQNLPTLLEKPVAADLAATERIVDLAGARDVPLMCGFVDRFNPAVLTVRSLLAGPPEHVVSVRRLPYYSRIRTGVTWDVLTHLTDLAIGLFAREPGSARMTTARLHPDSTAEDAADMVADFGNALACLSVSKVAQRRSWLLHVTCPDRELVADLVRLSVVSYRGGASIEEPLVSAREPLAAQFDHFLDLVDGKVDAAAELASILPAHRVVGKAS